MRTIRIRPIRVTIISGSVCYAVDAQRRIYVTEVVYSREGMEVTEEVVAAMLQQVPGCDVLVESNNGGRGFARAVSRLCPNHRIGWFCQSANKEARILSNASAVLRNICMPVDWVARWPEFAHDLLSYRRIFRTNRWHDAPDVLTGIAEREICGYALQKDKGAQLQKVMRQSMARHPGEHKNEDGKTHVYPFHQVRSVRLMRYGNLIP